MRSGYLLGTTNFLLMNYPKISPDCLVNLDTGKIDILGKADKEMLKYSEYDKEFYATVCKVIL